MRRRVRWARRVWLGPALGVLGVGALACAQPIAAQSLDPKELAHSEFSLKKAGDVQTPSDVEERAATIPAPQSFDQTTGERPVAAQPPAPVPVAQGLPAEVLALDSNMGAKVNDVLACRLEIAADRRVKVENVPAGQVLARWTLEPSGAVDAVEVVARQPTDPDVLSCARRKIASWLFVRAPGGAPLHIEQPLAFQ